MIRSFAFILVLSAMSPLLAMHGEDDVFEKCRALLVALEKPFTIRIYGELHDDSKDRARRRTLIEGAPKSRALLALEGVPLNAQAHLRIIGESTAGVPIGTLESGIFGLEDEHSYALGISVMTLVLLTEQIETMKELIKKRDTTALLKSSVDYENLLVQFLAKIANSKSGREGWRGSRKSPFASPEVEAVALDIDRVVASAEELNGQIQLSLIKFNHRGWTNFEGVQLVFRNHLFSLIQSIRALEGAETMASALNLAERIVSNRDQDAIHEFSQTVLFKMRNEAFARNISEIVIRALESQKFSVDAVMGEDHTEGVAQILSERFGAAVRIEFEHSQSLDSKYFDPINEVRLKLTGEMDLLRAQISNAQDEKSTQTLQNRLKMTHANLLYFEAMKDVLRRAESVIGKPATRQFGKEILSALHIGFGELGRDQINPAANRNYSDDQLERKVRVLLDAGMADVQVIELLRSEILGIDLPLAE